MRIEPARRLRGKLRLPGDKSISHRAAIIAALAQGGGLSRITNFSTSADCASTLSVLRALGVSISRDADAVVVEAGAVEQETQRRSRPRLFTRAPFEALDCGNSGSTMRMLAGVLAAQPFASALTGDESLRARPMRRIVEPLERMGARVHTQEGCAPLRIEGRRPLEAIRYEMPVASAQVKSAILLAALGARGLTEVCERHAATRDHTERMLRWFGVPVETASGIVSVEGEAGFAARDIDVPGDISSAAFLLVAAALLPGSELQLVGVGLNPTRARILQTMRSLGASVEISDVREQCHEERGDLVVRGTRGLRSETGVLRGEAVAQLIDELPVLAVLGTQVEGGLEIRDASELRVKESDRIRATVENLRAMGADVEEYADGLAVGGSTRLRGARLDARGDHRIAMAFTVAALVAEGASELEGAETVAISFPEFFQLLESVTER